MRVAVVGAGLAGLATAYHLLQKGIGVSLFDKEGIAKGASKISIGLLHPFVGKSGDKSKFGDEGLEATKELLFLSEKALGRSVFQRNGVFRKGWKPTKSYQEVEKRGEGYFIKTGMHVNIPDYLLGLYKVLGIPFIQREVIDPLEGFDATVFATGREVNEDLGVQFIKGQVLKIHSNLDFSIPSTGGGHVVSFSENVIQVGSTYEHRFDNDEPDIEKALSYLKPRIRKFYPEIDDWEVIEAQSGVRVHPKGGSYLPLIGKRSSREYYFTGLGSRGLLYHALFAERLVSGFFS